MISTSGRYWTTGITVAYQPHSDSWGASLDYCDDGFANDDPEKGLVSTEGTLTTRYAVKASETRSGLAIAVDNLLADAKRLGIEFIGGADTAPFLYYRGDGEHDDFPPPDGWRENLAAEAERIGFTSYQQAATDA